MFKTLIGLYRALYEIWFIGLHVSYLALFFGSFADDGYSYYWKLYWGPFAFFWISALLAPTLRSPSAFFDRVEKIVTPITGVLMKVAMFIMIIPLLLSAFFVFWYGMTLFNAPLRFLTSEQFPGTLAAALLGLFYLIVFKFFPKEEDPSAFDVENTISGE